MRSGSTQTHANSDSMLTTSPKRACSKARWKVILITISCPPTVPWKQQSSSIVRKKAKTTIERGEKNHVGLNVSADVKSAEISGITTFGLMTLVNCKNALVMSAPLALISVKRRKKEESYTRGNYHLQIQVQVTLPATHNQNGPG